eukprot:TRINITY_DN3980_c0_g1_i1.p1 TRINITY_DN3980_c0_g1~~TRINITY_DN3980_c0_g1_i1.p1  ORF type:complete len:407 (+),score=158.30 TRINITY_DN3980_c0_g1_i1:148-1368(+)
MEDRDAEVLMAADGVRLFLVEGESRQLLDEGELLILSAEVSSEESNVARDDFATIDEDTTNLTLMVMGDLSVPLVKHVPAMQVAPKMFMVAANEGKFYGVQFPEAVEAESLNVFESILAEHTSFRRDGEEGIVILAEDAEGDQDAPPPELSKRDEKITKGADKISTGITKGSLFVAAGLKKGAKMGVSGIKSTSRFFKSKIKKREKEVHVSDKTKARAQKARMMSKSVVTVSNTLVSGVVAMSGAMAKSLADSIGKTEIGKKISSGQSGPKARAAKQVAFATFGAVSTIYTSMHEAGKELLVAGGDATADVIGHRYGEDAEALARTTGGAVGDLGTAALNMKSLGVKSVAKATAKQTAKEMVKSPDQRAKEKEESAGGMDAGKLMLGAVMMSGEKSEKPEKEEKEE